MTTRMLGKRRPRLDARTLEFAKYAMALPPPPVAKFYQAKVHGWPMFMNDSLGDCVPAAMGHMVEQWDMYADIIGKPVTDADVLKAYEGIGGYVPGDPATDNGCDMLTSLNYWRNTGIAGHSIMAYAKVNPMSTVSVRNSIVLFGNCYIGLALPLYVQGSDDWQLAGHSVLADQKEPGSWGGHCVPLVGYSGHGLHFISWSGSLRMSWEFFTTYCDEAYAVVTKDWIRADGKSPSGFDIDTLTADLVKVIV
jgi:hypothetical protein